MSNFNFDKNSINKLKDMLNKGELDDIVSQISPEMIQNFSSMMNNNSNSNNFSNANQSENTSNFQNSSKSNSSGKTNFNFNNIDINTFLKMKSIMEKMNTNNDPGSNLLNSLKPYLRNSRKEKVDQYANLLNLVKIAELLKNDNKEKPDV